MIVLDTHVVLWWGNQSRELSSAAAAAIDGERAHETGCILLSAISAWEIAMLVRANRLDLATDVDTWINTLSELPQVQSVPVNNAVAIQSVMLPGDFHKDPVDRIIVATARVASATLLSADGKIQAYPHVETLW
jgi:PIN domain nuclease of toxin-antitoxin system